jgi:hypothetical protein
VLSVVKRSAVQASKVRRDRVWEEHIDRSRSLFFQLSLVQSAAWVLDAQCTYSIEMPMQDLALHRRTAIQMGLPADKFPITNSLEGFHEFDP